MNIREAKKEDWDAIWPIFQEIVSAGENYAYETNTSKNQAEKIWLDALVEFLYSKKIARY